jgi:hypothetical protein
MALRCEQMEKRKEQEHLFILIVLQTLLGKHFNLYLFILEKGSLAKLTREYHSLRLPFEFGPSLLGNTKKT